MLNITLSSTCNLINIVSTVSNYSDTDIESISITTSTNCCDTVIAKSITDFTTPDALLVDVDGVRQIQLTPEFFNTIDSISDAIYSITVRVTKTDNSYIEEVGCLLIDCNIKCLILDLIEKGDYEAHRIYESIQMAIACDGTDCDCSTACSLFKLLLDKLNMNNITTNEKIDDCGC